ncbi:MAG: hypothetical protein QJR14_08235 [Bacillota bacterium]|nr:hypothetical protein [Bacillota bacterium]
MVAMICPYCGARNERTAGRCRRCGLELDPYWSVDPARLPANVGRLLRRRARAGGAAGLAIRLLALLMVAGVLLYVLHDAAFLIRSILHG